MTETMLHGIRVSIYGLGTVFAALIMCAALVLLMRRSMTKRISGRSAAGPAGGPGQG